MKWLESRRARRSAERVAMSEIQRFAQDGIPVIATIAALLLLFASRVHSPAWFYPDRVGTAGEWFGGILTAIVLIWALLEPERVRQRDRRERDGTAAESAIRAIYASGVRHQDPLPDDLRRACRTLYDELEIQRELISSRDVSRRMRALMVFLAYVFDDARRLRENISAEALFDEVRIVADCCKAQLFCAWRDEHPPDWPWPDGLPTDDGDPVEEWIRRNLAAG